MTKKDEKQMIGRRDCGEERINPYKGLRSYEEEDRNLFYGRSRESFDLYHQVKLNFLTVVFGKAGIGKTSLLNAGVFPLLREDGLLPVRVRLNYAEGAPPLREQIRQALIDELRENNIFIRHFEKDEPANPMAKDETLWEYFHRTIHISKADETVVTPVMVFDQFEEIFTVGKDHPERESLLDELYWLIENQLPGFLRDQLCKGSGEFPFTTSRPDNRVIISIREDYIPHLIELKAQITTIDRVMIRVVHLTGSQAREIVKMPGGFREENIVRDILRLFYPKGTPRDVNIEDEKLEVEPTFISLLCYQLFEKQEMSPICQEDQDMVLEKYYDTVTKPFGEEVKNFIESRLLTEGGFRTPFFLEPGHRLSDEISKLVHQRLLRRFHDAGKEYIEIIHDVLTPVINKKKIRRGNRKKNKIIAVLILLVLFFAGMAFYGFHQKNRANHQYKRAQVHRLTAETLMEIPKDNNKALRIAAVAYRMGLPEPPPRTVQALCTAGYLTFEKPSCTDTFHYNERVHSAVFSPDGNYILTASSNETAKLWDLNGKQVSEYKHHGKVNSAVFSPDGKLVLTSSSDCTAKVWNLKGNIKFILKSHKEGVLFSRFSPDGSMILTASEDGTAKLWTSRGKLLTNFNRHNGSVISAAFSSVGAHRVLTASSYGNVKEWNFKGELISSYNHDSRIISVAYSPVGNQVLTTSSDGSVRLWDEMGKVDEIIRHKERVLPAIFSPNGRYILTASTDWNILLWDIGKEELRSFKGHRGRVRSAVFSPDGERILTASSDGTAKIWNLDLALLANLDEKSDWVNIAAFSPDGNKVLTCSSGGIGKLWHLQGQLLSVLRHQSSVDASEFSPGGDHIITVTSKGIATLWNIKSLFPQILRHEDVKSANFSPDGKWVVTASKNGTIKLWQLNGQYKAQFKAHSHQVLSASFSPDSKLILTISADQTAKLWSTQGVLISFFKHNDWVKKGCFSPDSGLILTVTGSGIARLWDCRGRLLCRFKDTYIDNAVFSPNCKHILTTDSNSGTIKLWDYSGQMVSSTDVHKNRVLSVVFSRSGNLVLTASTDNTAKLWTIEGKVIASFEEHSKWVQNAVFSPDGKYILTASSDYTAKLWNLKGQLLADLNKHNGYVFFAVFTPDGKRILTASADGTAKLWYTPEAIYEWLQTAPIPQLSDKDKKELGIDID